MSDAEAIIKNAIQTRTNIGANYGGWHRELSPHLLGYKNRVLHLLSYQYGGESRSGLSSNLEENWRCMKVSDLSEVCAISGDFVSHSFHTGPSTCVDEVVAKVQY